MLPYFSGDASNFDSYRDEHFLRLDALSKHVHIARAIIYGEIGQRQACKSLVTTVQRIQKLRVCRPKIYVVAQSVRVVQGLAGWFALSKLNQFVHGASHVAVAQLVDNGHARDVMGACQWHVALQSHLRLNQGGLCVVVGGPDVLRVLCVEHDPCVLRFL